MNAKCTCAFPCGGTEDSCPCSPSSKMTARLNTAFIMAQNAHEGQEDRQGKPYIAHPLRVSQNPLLVDTIDRIIALLHDTVEDTDMSVIEIRMGFGDEIALCVDNLTHRKGESKEDYFERINSHERSARVKYCDTMDNLNRDRTGVDEETCTRWDKKYAKYLELNKFKPSA